MVVAGATKRNTGVNILTLGGIVFSLDTLGVNLSVRVSRVHEAYCPSNVGPHMPEVGREVTSFFRPTTINMNRIFPLYPIRSKYGQFGSGLATGDRSASIAASEE